MALLLAALSLALTRGPADDKAYLADLSKWRQEREARLKADEGWLSVAGLFWFQQGENSLGTAEGSTVRLPRGTAQPRTGTFTLSGRAVHFKADEGAKVQIDGKPAVEQDLKSDASENPDTLLIGRLKLRVIERGERIGIRMFDPQSDAMKAFKGRHWFKGDPKYRVTARFVPYAAPKKIPITNILGDVSMSDSLGYIEFSFGGKTYQLQTEDAGDGLFINFQDATSGKTTYGAGRFLDTDKPVNGEVIVDFNRAVCPPCAFTAFATCPLPPKGNRLPIAINAGEKKQPGH